MTTILVTLVLVAVAMELLSDRVRTRKPERGPVARMLHNLPPGWPAC